MNLTRDYPAEFRDRLLYLTSAKDPQSGQRIPLSPKEGRMLRMLNDVQVIKTSKRVLKEIIESPRGDIEGFWSFIEQAAELIDHRPNGVRLFVPGHGAEFYTTSEVVEIREGLGALAGEFRDSLRKHAQLHHFADIEALDDLLGRFLDAPAIKAPRATQQTVPNPARAGGANNWSNYILERLFILACAHLGERRPALVTAVHRALLELEAPVSIANAHNYSAPKTQLVSYDRHAATFHPYQPARRRLFAAASFTQTRKPPT